MVRDSWGSPMKITSMISGNSINEEWFYKSTTLFFEDNKLLGLETVKRLIPVLVFADKKFFLFCP